MSLRNHGYKEVIEFLAKKGFYLQRQKGSHLFYRHPDGRTTVVPRHNVIAVRTLKSIFDQTQLDEKEFIDFCK
ncbi:MAG: type II toxin-antitoxin system HicA family toxin [Candidatus Nitrosocosmicus sp.]